MKILALNWRDIGDPVGGGAEMHLHEILKGAVSAGHEVDLVVAGYEGAAEREVVDGVTIHRKGHWSVANFVLPGVVRRLLKEKSYDLLVEDINKVPFYSPLYAGRFPSWRSSRTSSAPRSSGRPTRWWRATCGAPSG